MKLNVVPASTGALWVRQGMRAFWKQPLALSGLFFMFIAITFLCSAVPVIGSLLALTLMPATSLGLMAATREVDLGKFPMPYIMAAGLRFGRERKRDMLLLGVLYAFSFIGVMMVSILIDGGEFARTHLIIGDESDVQTILDPELQKAMWLSMLLYIPISALFWHAPALVHWHAVPAVKSMFFSLVACFRNWRAFLVFGLTWVIVSVGTALVITLITSAFGDTDFSSHAVMSSMLAIWAMFYCSTYFSFRDCFVADVVIYA